MTGDNGHPHTVAPDWNPRHDPVFRDAWLNYLVANMGRWVRATDVWECADTSQRLDLQHVAWETVDLARGLGHIIEGDRKRGYRYRGAKLVPYLRHHPRKRGARRHG